MKVYFESITDRIQDMQREYEIKTGVRPNTLELTQIEFEELIKIYQGDAEYIIRPYTSGKSTFLGMKIKIID